MKRIRLILTALAVFSSIAVYAKSVEASSLTLVGKLFPDTPNPYHRVDTVRFKGFNEMENFQMRSSSGIAVAFRTNSKSISVRAVYEKILSKRASNRFTAGGFDLYIRRDGKWLWAGNAAPMDEGGSNGRSMSLVKDMDGTWHQCLMYLPNFSEIRSLKIVVEDGAEIIPDANPFRNRIGVFGSSLTHGSGTSRPGMTWVSQFSRMTGWQMLSLGVGGRCLLQPYFADVLAEADVDALVFDAFSNPSAEIIEERLLPFIGRIREKKPEVPMIFINTLYREGRNFNTKTDAFERAKVEKAEEMMKKAMEAYEGVYWINTMSTTLPSHDTSVDGTHPTDYGYTLYAMSIRDTLNALLKKTLGYEDPFEEISRDPSRGGSVFTMYPTEFPVLPAAPKGYKPFYISHYGRHGARYESSEKKYAAILEMLSAGHDEGMLTEKGEDFYERYKAEYPYLKGRAGSLSGKGGKQHEGIARRMFRNYPEVFRGKALVDARSSTTPRCTVSMEHFIGALSKCNPRLRIESAVRKEDMAFLNPSSEEHPDMTPTDEGFNNRYAYWQGRYKALCAENTDPEEFFGRLFKDWSFVKRFEDPSKMEINIYYVAASGPCTDYEELYWDLFTLEEVCRLWECSNFRYYSSKGPDDIQGGRQWAFGWTLADDILKGAEKDFREGRSARLRFGHDLGVIALMTLLDVKGWSTAATEPHDVRCFWQDYRVPMAANVQFVFYKGRKGDIIVRPLLNEAQFELPIEAASPGFYRWEDFKSYLEERIALSRRILATTLPPPSGK